MKKKKMCAHKISNTSKYGMTYINFFPQMKDPNKASLKKIKVQ